MKLKIAVDGDSIKIKGLKIDDGCLGNFLLCAK